MRFAFSEVFPHLLYLLLANLEIVSISGEDFKGDRFIVLTLFKFSQYFFEIDDAGTDREVVVFLAKVVIRMDMTDAMTITTNEL